MYNFNMENIHIDYLLLGSLFKFYRENKNISRKSLITILKNNNHSNSCSYITLRRIEEGTPSLTTRFYTEIADALGFSLNLDPLIYCDLENHINSLCKIINNDMPISVLINKREEVFLFYECHKRDIYLSQLSRLMIMVLDMYLTDQINDFELIPVIDASINSMNSDLKLLASFALYTFSLRYYWKTTETKDYMHLGKDLLGKRLFVLHEIYYDLFTLNTFDLYKKYKKLNDSFNTNNQKIYLFSILSGLACSELNLNNYVEAHQHLGEALKIDDISMLLPQHVFLNTLKRFGIINYQMKNYTECFKYLSNIYKTDKYLLDMNYILLFKSAEFTDKVSEVKELIDKETECFDNTQVKAAFLYFGAKFNQVTPPSVLENMICKRLKDSLFDSGIYTSIFKKELMDLVSQTKHYKALYDFFQE